MKYTLIQFVIDKRVFNVTHIIHSWQPSHSVFETTYYIKDDLENDIIISGLNENDILTKFSKRFT